MKKTTLNKQNRLKSKKGNVLVYASIFLFVGTVTTIMLLALKKKGENDLVAESDTNTSSGGGGFCKHGDSFPLKYGSCGSNVKAFQRILKGKGADLGTAGIDGKYGNKTERAAEKYFKNSLISLSLAKTLNIA